MLEQFTTDAERFSKLRQQFESAEPFHHIVLDDFLDPLTAAELELELRTLPESTWIDDSSPLRHINNQEDGPFQSKKVALNHPSKLPPKAKSAIDFFHSEDFLRFLAAVTGIEEPLLPDEELLGGGVHRTTTGGHLSIHADFNIHKNSMKHRRLNVLLYLNSGWRPQHNGQLELWKTDMSACVRKIEPIANRLIIFRIRDDAFHGHPEPWMGDKNFPRLSLALYYYSDDRPEEEKSAFHWALFQDTSKKKKEQVDT